MGHRLPRVWIITEPRHPDGPVEPLRRALGNVPRPDVGVQLRAKQASDRELLAWGRSLRALTGDRGACLTVNGRADVARRIGAEGVHVGETGVPISRLRHLTPSVGWIGASRHDRQGVVTAEASGADYVFVSPIFYVPGKSPPLGIEAFQRSIEGVSAPAFALGGIGPDHVGPLVRAGAYGIAVRRMIYQAADPAAALDRLLDGLDNLPAPGG